MYDEDPDEWTVPCPHCDRDIYDDVDQCPHCQMYLSSADHQRKFPVWVAIIILVTIAGFFLASIRI